MTTVNISPQAVRDMYSTTLFNGSYSTVQGAAGNNYTGTTYNTFLWVYQGTVPDATDTNLNDTTNIQTLRSADRLMRFSYNSSSNSYWIPTVTGSQNTRTFTPASNVYATAAISGVATWFLLFGVNLGQGYYNDFPSASVNGIALQLGTISGPGGGGDLVFQNPSIVANKIYNLGQISFSYPNSFTYP